MKTIQSWILVVLVADRRLAIEFLDPGAKLYVFSFG